MDWKLIFWLFSFIVFWGYASWFVFKYNLPISWSNTFYRLNQIYESKQKGYLLTGVLWGMALPLLPVALSGGHNLMFPVIAAIMFIGAAPAFKSDKLEYWVHMTGSYVSVLLGIITFAASYNLYWVAILNTVLVALLYLEVFKKDYLTTNKIMWIESLVILSGQLVVLFKDVL